VVKWKFAKLILKHELITVAGTFVTNFLINWGLKNIIVINIANQIGQIWKLIRKIVLAEESKKYFGIRKIYLRIGNFAICYSIK
jgi:hypothetical protein